MTSMPASRSAMTTSAMPRSCPHKPGLPMSTRILRCCMFIGFLSERRRLGVLAEHVPQRAADLADRGVDTDRLDDRRNQVGFGACRLRGGRLDALERFLNGCEIC